MSDEDLRLGFIGYERIGYYTVHKKCSKSLGGGPSNVPGDYNYYDYSGNGPITKEEAIRRMKARDD